MSELADWWRAVTQTARNFAQSETGKTIGKSGLEALLKQFLPHLTQYIDDKIHDIWDWYKQNYR